MSENKEKGIIPSLLETQSLIALIMIGAFIGGIFFALYKAISVPDILSILQLIAAPASLIVGFFFGKKAAE